MRSVTCPYCDDEVDIIDDEGFDQDSHHEQECPWCEKIFKFSVYYSPYYNAYPTPCLNDGKHDWHYYDYSNDKYMLRIYKMRRTCDVCGTEESEPQTKEEHDRLYKEWKEEHDRLYKEWKEEVENNKEG